MWSSGLQKTFFEERDPRDLFWPRLESSLGGYGRKTKTLVWNHKYFIPTTFHQNPSSGSGEEVENMKSLRRADDARHSMTKAHSSLQLR